jgi:hypothetical protein
MEAVSENPTTLVSDVVLLVPYLEDPSLLLFSLLSGSEGVRKKYLG